MAENAIEELLVHARELRGREGVTGTAIGLKEVGGNEVPELAVIVFVDHKLPRGRLSAAIAVPSMINGVHTDVVEREFDIEHTATDPDARHDPIFSGITIAAERQKSTVGSIGCFIACDGGGGVPKGNYLLTNQHVVVGASPDGNVIQPGTTGSVPANSIFGKYVSGREDRENDAAIVTVASRGWENKVPAAPWVPGKETLAGVADPAVDAEVYKYGRTSKYTKGKVKYIEFSYGGVDRAVYIEAASKGDTWIAGGDSGSVLVLRNSHVVIGLNFAGDATKKTSSGYSAGLAFPIRRQMALFGSTKLAK